MNEQTPVGVQGSFVTTRWTLVRRASGSSTDARFALGELCNAYWHPVFHFLRREGKDEDAARELTQEFFATLLAGSGFENVQAGKSRFRSYLLGALKHFLSDQKKQTMRLKRGGGLVIESLDAPLKSGTDTTAQVEIEDPTAQVPDTVFDREWGRTVMSRALDALQAEFAGASRGPEFEVLKPWLVGNCEALSYREAAAALGTTEGALKVAIHRMRKRFREIIRSELLQTVDTPAEVEEELRYLVQVLL